MKPSPADRVWNRAAVEGGGREPREGDRALSALLLAHGLIMNGGVEHARDALDAGQLEAAIAGYRSFGLATVAELLERARRAGESELEGADLEYSRLIPGDAALVSRFEARLRRAPEDFAPLAPGEGEIPTSVDLGLELAARKRRRSGVLAVLLALALVGLLVARGRGFELATPTLLLAALLLGWQLFAIWRLQPARVRQELEARLPGYCFTVEFDGERITLHDPLGRTESLAWVDLGRIRVVTTGEGPDRSDVFWVLEAGSASLRVPQEAAGQPRLLARLQELPGWRDEEVIRAMSSTRDAEFTCWEAPG